MEDLFDFISLKGDGLEVSFVVIVEERQGLARVCGGWGSGLVVRDDRKGWCSHQVETCTLYYLRLLLLDSNKDLVYNNSERRQLDNISNKQLDEHIEEICE